MKGDRAAAAAELSGNNYLERAVSAFLDGKKFSEESDDETPMPFTVLERDALTAAAGETFLKTLRRKGLCRLSR